jgi:uncharacterized protein with LGFP repeats
MRHNKARFVTICQQVLVVGAALAVLGPAADVISLDVVTHPEAAFGPYREAPAVRDAVRKPRPAPKARVESAPVDPVVTEVPVAPAPAQSAPSASTGTSGTAAAQASATKGAAVPRGGQVQVSAPEDVAGYGAIGVTWKSGSAEIDEDKITIQSRTLEGGVWSDWDTLKYHAEEGPDQNTSEGRQARPGTDPLIIGDVDQVQTRVITSAGVNPADLQMAVVDPGKSTGTVQQAPAIDVPAATAGAAPEQLTTSAGAIALSAGASVAQPTIYSRAQWGADESIRRAAPSYGTISAGFVHHTVNANDYTPEQVPGIIRSIYAYHVKTKGWNDIGYNFLIDRFGRIWEGRYGGVDKPVIGAHTEGYNSYAFAASAIGNFEQVQPTPELLDAYGRLFAWKLSLHGIDAQSTSQKVGTRTLPAINGHRDVGSTACPGRYLYAQIPTIRTKAAAVQAGAGTAAPQAGTPRVPNLAGDGYPDLVMRRAGDGAAFVIPTGGGTSFESQRALSTGWSRYDVKVVAPDLTNDGVADMLVRIKSTGTAGVRPGLGNGSFGRALKPLTIFRGYDQITPVGRFDANSTGDVVARQKSTGALVLFRGNGAGGFSRLKIATGWGRYNKTIATGDITGDGKADLLARNAYGKIFRFAGNGKGGLGAPTRIAGSWAFPVVTGYGDLTSDGMNDLLVRSSAGATYIAPGNGSGAFGKLLGPVPSGLAGLANVSAAQVVGSGEPDAIGFAGDTMVLVAHTGRQNLRPGILAGVSFAAANLVLNVGDWDGDGRADVITRVASNGHLLFYRGTGDGHLTGGSEIDSRNFNAVRSLSPAGDLTGDGKPDLIADSGGKLVVFPGAGSAALGAASVLKDSIATDGVLGLGRWDGDAPLDTALRVGNSMTWLPNSQGTAQGLSADLTGLTAVMAAGDLNGDGRTDLVGRSDTDTLWLLVGTASGFGPKQLLGQGYSGFDLIG